MMTMVCSRFKDLYDDDGVFKDLYDDDGVFKVLYDDDGVQGFI